MPTDVGLQRGVREGRRRSIPVAHNSHLEHRYRYDTTTQTGRDAGPAHTRPRPTSGPRLARRINNQILALASPTLSSSRLPPHNQSVPLAACPPATPSSRAIGNVPYIAVHRWRFYTFNFVLLINLLLKTIRKTRFCRSKFKIQVH